MARVADKKEPQELSLADAEESKSSAEQWTGMSSPQELRAATLSLATTMADRQPQSLVLQEPPHLSDQSVLLRRHAEFRALQSQLAHLRIENEELRRQLDRGSRGVQRMPNELKWLLYFRAPISKAQVLAIVRSGLAALFAKDPSFRGYECATFWAAEELSDWRAFRIDYAGFKLAAFRTAMKAAHTEAQLPANRVRTTQPSSVALYRQLPEVPPLFAGTLEELAGILPDDVQRFAM